VKITTHRLIHVFLMLLLCGNLALGQNASQPGNKKQRSLDDTGSTRLMPQLKKENFREADPSQPPAEITFQEMRYGRPPLLYLFFDVVLRNDRRSPRWFLLPSNLGPGHGLIGEKGGVDTLQVFTPRGNGQVIIGRFLGTGGFQALLLPPRAEVRLRRFPISFWGEIPANLQIEIVIASQLTIGDETAERWFGVKALSSARADISEDAESVKRLVHTKRSRDNKEVLPLIEEDQRLHLSVSLKSKN
jgi:hypothetical protein